MLECMLESSETDGLGKEKVLMKSNNESRAIRNFFGFVRWMRRANMMEVFRY